MAWQFHPDRAAWAQFGITDFAEVRAWVGHGFQPDEQMRGWRAAGVAPSVAARWHAAQFSVEETREWAAVTDDPAEAAAWIREGFRMTAAYTWKQLTGLAPETAAEWDAQAFLPVETAAYRSAGASLDVACWMRQWQVPATAVPDLAKIVSDPNSRDDWLRAVRSTGQHPD